MAAEAARLEEAERKETERKEAERKEEEGKATESEEDALGQQLKRMEIAEGKKKQTEEAGAEVEEGQKSAAAEEKVAEFEAETAAVGIGRAKEGLDQVGFETVDMRKGILNGLVMLAVADEDKDKLLEVPKGVEEELEGKEKKPADAKTELAIALGRERAARKMSKDARGARGKEGHAQKVSNV